MNIRDLLRDASIQLNNGALSLPQDDWLTARAACDALDGIRRGDRG